MARFEIPGHRGEKHVSDLKGLLSWRQRPEVPSEKPKHKNNSMSKNKIPSSEVAGPGPSLRQALPLFPAHGGARPAGGLERATARPSSRDGAVWRPRAPSRGHRWDCSPRREAAAALKPRRPGDRGPRVAAALALASLDSTAVPVGATHFRPALSAAP